MANKEHNFKRNRDGYHECTVCKQDAESCFDAASGKYRPCPGKFDPDAPDPYALPARQRHGK